MFNAYLMCSSKELLSLQAFSHTGHIKFDVFEWVVMCARKVDRLPKDLSHCGQAKLFSPVWVTR